MAEIKINISDKIKSKGLKLTTQRIIILEAVSKLGNHPSTEEIVKYVRTDHPAISQGTIYKTLETFAENKIINKVETSGGIFRYDAITKMHHHLHEENTSRIEDYYDEELNKILLNYFLNKRIPDFTINDIKLHIKGNFNI